MILVTGGTGFIGRHLIRALVSAGHKVRVLLRPSKESPGFPRGIPVEVAVSSLGDQRNLRAALRDVDVVYHLAGAERDGIRGSLNQTDIEGTKNLVAAMEGLSIKQLFYLSHLGADRSSAYPVHRAKGIAENSIISSGIPYTIFRSSIVFGPGDHFTIPLMKTLRLSPGVFLMPGDGKSLLQPLYIEDLVYCLLLSLSEPRLINRIVSVGGIETISYHEIIGIIKSAKGIRRNLVSVSPQFLRVLSLWIDQLYPRFPISIFWLDYLAQDRITQLDTIPREFNLLPARFRSNLGYMTEK